MDIYGTKQIRNVVLLGHGGAGKTTVAEALAYLTGVTKRMGKVADGNTISDYDKEEIKRQFSISTTMVPIEYEGAEGKIKINLLDTPGYFDFVGEVEEAVSAADAAIIVVNCKAGIEVGKTPWMWKDNLASWTWPGYEGETASVDVYANADEVELFLNGESLGRKSIGGVYVVTYEVPYHPGKLEAVSYLNGAEAGRTVLQTAGKAVKLKVEADRNELPADGESLTFVKIRLEDAAGNFNRREGAAVTIKVEGCAALQGFGSADPSCEGSYQSHTWNTYDGSVMAVIRAAKCPGEAIVTISAVNFAEEKLVLNIK